MIHVVLPIVALAFMVGACSEATTDPKVPVAVSFDSLPSPSVVLGDTLRNSDGVVAPLTALAFNFRGEVISGIAFRYFAAERGLRVDSITGIVIGDSIRAAPPRVIASFGNIQALKPLDVTLRPDRVIATNGRDSLQYSLTDSTKNLSPALTVTVQHLEGIVTSPVRTYIVSFAITAPANATLASLVNEGGRPSAVDTTDASGVAGRRILLRPVALVSARDSVVVQATVKYRGVPVSGSPVRLTLIVKP